MSKFLNERYRKLERLYAGRTAKGHGADQTEYQRVALSAGTEGLRGDQQQRKLQI